MTNPILAAIDIETTGFLAADHRIVEVHIGFYQNRKKVFDYEQRIDPQRSMPADAQRVHGISGADLMGKPTWDTVGPTVFGVLSRAQAYVWHNGDEFDGPFIDQELKRIGLPGLPARPSLDTMLASLWATHNGKKPRLEELCFACGVTYDKLLAHAAAYDTDRMMQCLFAGIDMGFFNLPDLAQAAVAA